MTVIFARGLLVVDAQGMLVTTSICHDNLPQLRVCRSALTGDAIMPASTSRSRIRLQPVFATAYLHFHVLVNGLDQYLSPNQFEKKSTDQAVVSLRFMEMQ